MVRLIIRVAYASLLLVTLVSCVAFESHAAVSPSEDASRDFAATHEVGIATVDITPDYPIRLNGFGSRREESDGIRQRIWAKAIAIGNTDQPGGPAVLITIDSLGIRMQMVDQVAKVLNERFGIARENVCVTFSHSHTTPKVNGASDNIFSTPIPADHQARIDRYTEELQENLIEVAIAAVENREPCLLHWGVGEVSFAINRRTKDGPVDHALPILTIRNADRELVGVYVSYACHCVTLSENLIGGDWAGYAQEAIERRFPGCVAMVSIGAGSDSNPSSGVTGDRADIAAVQGAEISDEVARLLKTELTPLQASLSCSLKMIELPLNPPPTREMLEAMVEQGGAIGYNASTHLDRLDRGEALETKIDYPIQVFEFDQELSIVFLAGEVCVDYSLRLKTELDRNRLWVNAYSNDFCSYIPSERLVREGGYGGGAEIPYFALPTTLKAGLEQLIIDAVKSMVPDDYDVPEGTQGVPARSPEASLRSMRLHERFRIELVASEPLIRDPVAVDFGQDGRVWVVEMPDYSQAVDASFEQRGAIKFLIDEDGDGQCDRSHVFLDGLRFPTDVKVWRDGILVCDAPDILFAKDTDGDGTADVREVVATGFATHNPHARVNSLRWGLDGWLYGSCGLFGGTITCRDGSIVELGGRDFRLDPDRGIVEPATGRTQQGRARNDWGDWFGCDNGTLIRHYPVFAEYARRNPYHPTPPTSQFVPSGDGAGTLFPPSDIVTFKLSGPPGRATSACGLGVYRDRLLGDDFYHNIFVCEPVNQLVYRQQVSRDGATYRGNRAPDELDRDFLVSTDQWFRPVQIRTGIDGGLWVVDMYRYVIEHGRWIPETTKAELELFAGSDRGRIYRITNNESNNHSMPDITRLDPITLCALMDTENGSLRDLAHQRIVWTHEDWSEGDIDSASRHLASIVETSQSSAVRIQAMYVLDAMDRLSSTQLRHFWEVEDAEVRRHILKLLEPLTTDMNNEDKAFWQAAFRELIADGSPALSCQLAYSLGEYDSELASRSLVQLLLHSRNDPYLHAAAMSSVTHDQVPRVLSTIRHLKQAQETDSLVVGELKQLAREMRMVVVRHADVEQQERLFDILFSDHMSDATSDRLIEAMNELSEFAAISRDDPSSWYQPLSRLQQDWCEKLEKQALGIVEDVSKRSDNDTTVAAIQLIGRLAGVSDSDSQDRMVDVLGSRLAASVPRSQQIAAVDGLCRIGNERAFEKLLSAVDTATPAILVRIRKGLFANNEWTVTLLDRIADGDIDRNIIDQATQVQLASNPDESIRESLGRIAEATAERPRQAVVEQFLREMPASGDSIAGRIVFAKHCSKCHKMEGVGESIGPDLAALTNRDRVALLESVLDPSRDVDRRYSVTTMLDERGRVWSGLIIDETDSSFTVRAADLTQQTVLRHLVESFSTSSISFMPDGFEKEITPNQMADLLAYLSQPSLVAKSFPGNEPQVVSATMNGFIRLPANRAFISGGAIRFEGPPFDNIGYWHDQHDRSTWVIDSQLAGEYIVRVQFSCAPSSSGNQLRLRGSMGELTWSVPSTGGWDQYRTAEIGRIELSENSDVITIDCGKPIDGALLDLASVEFVLVGEDDETDSRVDRWSKFWSQDLERMKEGVAKAEAFRRELLEPGDDGESQIDRIINAVCSFQMRSNEALRDRPNIDSFDLDPDALRTKASGDTALIDSEAFASFDGRWFGKWDQMNVDHWWHPTQSFDNPFWIDEGLPVLNQRQFAWIGDGFGWNYIVTPSGQNERVILGMVYHVHSEQPSEISFERPHLGIAFEGGKLIWITRGEVFFEEAFVDNGSQRYAITGFHYEIREGEVVQKGEAFQAIYTRDENDRPEFYKF